MTLCRGEATVFRVKIKSKQGQTCTVSCTLDRAGKIQLLNEAVEEEQRGF